MIFATTDQGMLSIHHKMLQDEPCLVHYVHTHTHILQLTIAI